MGSRQGHEVTLERKTPLRARSRRTAKTYRDERRPLVARLLEQRPKCERCESARSTEVHELLSRARGGSITDEKNCVALCHECHSWITTNPAEATADGWLKHSWERKGGAA
jgi:5-methylcytosine-specific restriction endonuclease McrA